MIAILPRELVPSQAPHYAHLSAATSSTTYIPVASSLLYRILQLGTSATGQTICSGRAHVQIWHSKGPIIRLIGELSLMAS